MVGNPGSLVHRQLGGADIEPFVELQRVAIYNFAAEFQGQLDRKVTFS